MSELILYDLPSKDRCSCWSLNTWKTRMALNYKGISYRTEWIEYPEIEPKAKQFGLSANEKGIPYTVPIVRFPDGSYMMDSGQIAARLEELYPEPTLTLGYDKFQEAYAHFIQIARTTYPCWMPKVPRNLLRPESIEYFRRTRSEWEGMPIEQYEKEQGTDERWDEVMTPAKALGDMLRSVSGPFFMGNAVSYIDFVLVSFLIFIKRIDEREFQKALSLDSAFGILYDACQEWLGRDD